MTGVVHGLSDNRRLLVRFQDGYENDIILNKLTDMTVDRIPVTEEDNVPVIYVMPDETIDLEK